MHLPRAPWTLSDTAYREKLNHSGGATLYSEWERKINVRFCQKLLRPLHYVLTFYIVACIASVVPELPTAVVFAALRCSLSAKNRTQPLLRPVFLSLPLCLVVLFHTSVYPKARA